MSPEVSLITACMNKWGECSLVTYPYRWDNMEIVKFLVEEQHMDVCCENDEGEIPFHIAAK